MNTLFIVRNKPLPSHISQGLRQASLPSEAATLLASGNVMVQDKFATESSLLPFFSAGKSSRIVVLEYEPDGVFDRGEDFRDVGALRIRFRKTPDTILNVNGSNASEIWESIHGITGSIYLGGEMCGKNGVGFVAEEDSEEGENPLFSYEIW